MHCVVYMYDIVCTARFDSSHSRGQPASAPHHLTHLISPRLATVMFSENPSSTRGPHADARQFDHEDDAHFRQVHQQIDERTDQVHSDRSSSHSFDFSRLAPLCRLSLSTFAALYLRRMDPQCWKMVVFGSVCRTACDTSSTHLRIYSHRDICATVSHVYARHAILHFRVLNRHGISCVWLLRRRKWEM